MQFTLAVTPHYTTTVEMVFLLNRKLVQIDFFYYLRICISNLLFT